MKADRVDSNPADDYYLVPARSASVDLKFSGSKFIGAAHRVSSEEEVARKLTVIRKRMHDATHHCTAFRIGADDHLERYNDDGEPSGTAGPPILRRIESANVTNVLVVVTRYYGGTKLGTGGLIRAYGETARMALEKSGTKRQLIERVFRVRFEYADTSIAMHLLDRFGARVVETTYGDQTEIEFAVPRSRASTIADTFRDESGNRLEVHPKGD